MPARALRGAIPRLAANIPLADHLAGAEIGLGDQHIDSRERRRNWRLRRLGLSTAAGEICGDAAGGQSDTEYDETRGFHYASLLT